MIYYLKYYLCQLSLNIDSFLSLDTEDTFINQLEGGNRKKAIKRLRVPPLGDKHGSPWTTFKLGFFCGAFIILLIAVALSGIFHDRYRSREISMTITVMKSSMDV